MMMMDKGTNLSMDDEPTICGTTMSLHLRELEDFCFCDHFDTNPNLLLQQNPSSLQSLCVVGSTTTTKKTQNPKNTTPSQHNTNTQQKIFHPHPTRQSTNTQLNNLKTTQQEKLHKHPTRDLKLTNTKSKSTKHPTTRKNPQITQHPTKRESTTTQQEI